MRIGNETTSASAVMNALTGAEVAEITLKAIQKHLADNDNFAAHITHPLCQVDFTIVLSTYPGEPTIRPSSGTVLLGDKDAKVGEKVEAGKIEGSWTCDSSTNDATPDGVRNEFGLDVMRPDVKAGITVDVPQATRR